MLAERFGCPVVGNFRVRDVAAGGLGAPLVPYTEFLLYRSETEHTALQNIGGIGNITLLPAGCALSDVTAFDTGPGNMLIDAAIARITNGEKRYDANGAMAASGRVSEALLAQLMRDPYLSRRPPKTTGREHYGAAFVDGIFAAANERKLSDADILATVTDFTAQTIAAAIPRLLRRASRAAHRRRGRQPQRHAHGGYRRGAPRRARAHERGSRL